MLITFSNLPKRLTKTFLIHQYCSSYIHPPLGISGPITVSSSLWHSSLPVYMFCTTCISTHNFEETRQAAYYQLYPWDYIIYNTRALRLLFWKSSIFLPDLWLPYDTHIYTWRICNWWRQRGGIWSDKINIWQSNSLRFIDFGYRTWTGPIFFFRLFYLTRWHLHNLPLPIKPQKPASVKFK